eukprot:6196502-Pleurochrysis_carterae.AAC.2
MEPSSRLEPMSTLTLGATKPCSNASIRETFKSTPSSVGAKLRRRQSKADSRLGGGGHNKDHHFARCENGGRAHVAARLSTRARAKSGVARRHREPRARSGRCASLASNREALKATRGISRRAGKSIGRKADASPAHAVGGQFTRLNGVEADAKPSAAQARATRIATGDCCLHQTRA